MSERFGNLSAEEQRIAVVAGVALAADLWIGLAWQDVSVLAAVPAIVAIGLAGLAVGRRRRPSMGEDADSGL